MYSDSDYIIGLFAILANITKHYYPNAETVHHWQ